MKKGTQLSWSVLFLVFVSLILVSCHSGKKKDITSDINESGWSNTKNIRWTYDVEGIGWSSPVISGDKVFITTAVNETHPVTVEVEPPPPPPVQNNDSARQRQAPRPNQGPPPPQKEDTTYKSEIYRWELTCLDLKTGNVVWKKTAQKGTPRIPSHKGNGYASETPVTDGKYVYAYFGMTGIFCYDMNGNLVWSKDPGAYKTLNGWGTGSSPVLYNDKVYLQIDNEASSFIVALDAKTGDEKWRVARDEKTNYSTPIIWKNSVRTELVTGGRTTRSYDPETGSLLWEMKLKGDISLPSPIAENDHIYIGNPGNKDTALFYCINAGATGKINEGEIKSSGGGVIWVNTAAGTGNPTPVIFNNLIYLLAGDGKTLNCLDASTGKTIYAQKLEKVAACWATPRVYNDNLYITDERGNTTIIKTGETFSVVAQYRLTDKIWASFATGKKEFVFKGAKKLYCIDIK